MNTYIAKDWLLLVECFVIVRFFFLSIRRHTRLQCDWSSDVCSSDLPLGVADTRSAQARVYLTRGDLERARDEEAKAIAQVERVMQSLSTPQQWSMFLRQYADLYAQT